MSPKLVLIVSFSTLRYIAHRYKGIIAISTITYEQLIDLAIQYRITL